MAMTSASAFTQFSVLTEAALNDDLASVMK